MKLCITIYFLTGFFFSLVPAMPQTPIGIPDIDNYTRQDYKAGNQIWGIAQDSRGIMFFANNAGLLSFDGTYWKLHALPNKTIVRSIAIDSTDRIYVGGQEEFGYFEPDANNDLHYTSLTASIPYGKGDFADVWNVVLDGKDVFFRSNRKIFRLHHNKINVFESYNWSFLCKAAGQIFAMDDRKGLLRFAGNKWDAYIYGGILPPHVQVSSILPLGRDSLMIATLNQGIFVWGHKRLQPFVTPTFTMLSRLNIYGAIALPGKQLAFITNFGGCLLTDTKGNLIQKFSKQEGLQNNNILSVFPDQKNNLWLGLDNGIDMIALHSPVQNILPEGNDLNAGYSACIFRQELYLGTATGIYSIPLMADGSFRSLRSGFRLIPGTNGQIWNISQVNGHLLFGHNKAAFEYSNHQLLALNTHVTGFWGFITLPRYPFRIVAGTYNGLYYFQESKDNQLRDADISIAFESAKYIAVTDSIVWAMHPYKGLYKISLDTSGRPIQATYLGRLPFLSKNHNHLYQLSNRIVTTSEKGIFEWDAKRQAFIRSSLFEKIFGKRNITYLKEDGKGNYWFCENDNIGMVDRSTLPYKIILFPELAHRIQTDDNENIYLPDSSHALIAGEKGFFYLDLAHYQQSAPDIRLLIRSIKVQNARKDSLIYGGYATDSSQNNIPAIHYGYNSISFNYTAIHYGKIAGIEYSYYLKGQDASWSLWTARTEKNYTNLAPGNYTFHVRMRNRYTGSKSSIAQYNFSILPPWYRTIGAYLAYAILGMAMIYAVHRWQKTRLQKQHLKKLAEQRQEYLRRQQELAVQHQLEIEKNEKALTQLENEKLTMTLSLKNETIAANAMSLVQKGELLSKIKKELTDIESDTTEEKNKSLKKIIRTVDRELTNKEDWERFSGYFDQVHNNFLQTMKQRYPQLSAGDLKLCALLYIGISSKEMADILNISLKGVEINRYRLRKKLDIPAKETLQNFLLNVFRDKA